ncbi:MAG: glycosyltransferase [Bdellovibrionales bacterium]|nr:glycosyltransferase [Bdellovibrionales bacterium]
MKIGLVIPCFNEAKRLDVKSFSQFLYEDKFSQVVFCFVNDGSQDETGSVLKDLSKKYPGQTLIIDRPNNLGKAASVREGILKMLSETQCDWLGFLGCRSSNSTF